MDNQNIGNNLETVQVQHLSNGMVVASDIMPSVETVTVSVLVKTGSRNEQPQINGISHFLEHMAFKGTNTRTARQIAEEFDMIGGYFNAYTSRERTVYYAKVMKEDLYTAVDILADIIQHSTYVEEELEKERGVIQQELAQTLDTPDDIVWDYFQEEAYPQQPIGRSILGTAEFLKTVSRQQIQDYVDDRYGFNNTIVAAAGNLDHEVFCQMVGQKFQKMSSDVSNVVEPAVYAGGDRRVQKDLEQVNIVLGFPAVSYMDENYYTQQVVSIIAGGGMSSRLFQEVREKRGLAYSIAAFSSSYKDTGIFGVYSGTNDISANELIDVSLEQLHDLTHNVSEEELQRAKAQVRASLLMSQESSVARAEKLAGHLASYGHHLLIAEIMKKIEAIDAQAVCRMMQSILYSGLKPTIASIGKIDKLYDYEAIIKKMAP